MTGEADTEHELSPAEAYAASRRRQSYPVFNDFASLYRFPLDDFQQRACHEIEDGRGVLVAAPTGSGKTIVGEFAIHLALATGRKAFYTTPIKALSNQKYNDLVARYGADKVGLLTGDNVVNGEAPIVIMTTEVLRNMLYASSSTLIGLGFVVMDEVHYLADRSRGAVWEEVIIHLPESVSVISLSATVSNAEEFGDWLTTVRGETTTIIEEKRPVPLFQHVMVGRRILDLFASSDVDAKAGFVKEGAPVNNELIKIARDDWASTRLMRDRRTPKGASRGGQQAGNGRRVWVPRRSDVIAALERQNLLPAIVFIFSRIGCDAAVQQCLADGVNLNGPEERDQVLDIIESACRDLPAEDRHVLGYHDFLDALSRGVAAHHAGMLPAFKEVVEDLYVQGLIKVVFATETLALGINMPARTVVIEKLTKWNGDAHVDLTPGEYTQLVGRAGRRGLDVEGHGVVMWQPGTNPRELAGLASTRTYPLKSSFRPSYNMAVNLVHHFGRARSRELLEQSFAQFQADRAVVGIARQVRKSEDAYAGYVESATCDRGDFMEYAGLRNQISELEKAAARDRRADRRVEIIASLGELKPGDIIQVPIGKFAGPALVLETGFDAESPRPYVLTLERQARRLALIDFNRPVVVRGRMRVPPKFNGRDPQQRRAVAQQLRHRVNELTPEPRLEKLARSDDPLDREVAALRLKVRDHPCHDCPDREEHARWAERAYKLHRDTDGLRRRVESRTNTVARQFDRVCDVLDALGYLDEDGVTERGRRLMRLYSELDLLAAESMRAGLWDDLNGPELAAALSALVYEARRMDESAPRIPGGRTKGVLQEMSGLARELMALERDYRLDFLRPPDVGFAWAAYRWAEGDDLDDVLGTVDMAAGDFVRNMKQLIDLCGQVADAAGDSPVRTTARGLIDKLKRGVIAYTTLD